MLAAVYVLWAYQRMMTGPTPPDLAVTPSEAGAGAASEAGSSVGSTSVIADVSRREVGVLAPLMLALVLFGFYPMPLMDVSNPTVDVLLEHVGVPDDGPDVPVEANEGAHD